MSGFCNRPKFNELERFIHDIPTGKIATYQCDVCSQMTTGREFIAVHEWKYIDGGFYIVPSDRTFVYCNCGHGEGNRDDGEKADIKVFVTEEE